MWPNPQKTADLVTFTKEILNENLHFLCGVFCGNLDTKTYKNIQLILFFKWTGLIW